MKKKQTLTVQIKPETTAIFKLGINIVINQSISLFVQKCNRQWTEHQGKMQPPRLF